MALPTFLEFFCGGGMARAGFGADWTCVFANDFDAAKGATYRSNWGEGELRVADIHALDPACIPDCADLAWASFPCQDLSLAGNGAGLSGARSSAFWGFRNLMQSLRQAGCAPKMLVLENVVGALTSNGGADFSVLCRALHELGYVFGALTIDAAHFVPQSRPRLFILALRKDLPNAMRLTAQTPSPVWTNSALLRAHANLDDELRAHWRWWALPAPPKLNTRLIDIIEASPPDVKWHSAGETARFLALMSDANLAKVATAKASGQRVVGAIYRRTRTDAQGNKLQRAEVRFDGLAGCLRTPGGGSSRQFIMMIEGGSVRTRLLSGREAARLMGLPDDYALPARYNAACHLLGDGVVAPVVKFLAEHLLMPLCAPSNLVTAAE